MFGLDFGKAKEDLKAILGHDEETQEQLGNAEEAKPDDMVFDDPYGDDDTVQYTGHTSAAELEQLATEAEAEGDEDAAKYYRANAAKLSSEEVNSILAAEPDAGEEEEEASVFRMPDFLAPAEAARPVEEKPGIDLDKLPDEPAVSEETEELDDDPRIHVLGEEDDDEKMETAPRIKILGNINDLPRMARPANKPEAQKAAEPTAAKPTDKPAAEAGSRRVPADVKTEAQTAKPAPAEPAKSAEPKTVAPEPAKPANVMTPPAPTPKPADATPSMPITITGVRDDNVTVKKGGRNIMGSIKLPWNPMEVALLAPQDIRVTGETGLATDNIAEFVIELLRSDPRLRDRARPIIEATHRPIAEVYFRKGDKELEQPLTVKQVDDELQELAVKFGGFAPKRHELYVKKYYIIDDSGAVTDEEPTEAELQAYHADKSRNSGK